MSAKKSIALICESKRRIECAYHLSSRLNIPLEMDSDTSCFDYLLVITDERLELRSANNQMTPLYVDFLNPELVRRRVKGGGRKEMIARAVGLKGGSKPSVLDATAGLGKDAFVLASLGCEVHCLERSPIVAALLEDGLARFFQQEKEAQLSITLTQIDAIYYLKACAEKKSYDVIYLDPMFPDKKKNALPKKGMRIFREILEGDPDAAALFQLALKHAKKRVVVKRPRHAETCDAHKPDVVFEGKSSRFDVYFVSNDKKGEVVC